MWTFFLNTLTLYGLASTMSIDSYLITYTLWSSTVSLVDSYLACGVCLLCSLLYVWSFLGGWSLLHSVMFYGNLHRQLMTV